MDQFKTIREVAVAWEKDKRQYVKQSSLSAYSLIIENHLLPTFGDKQQLVESEIQDFALRKLREGLSRKTVKDMLVVLKMIYRFGMKKGDLPIAEWSVKFPTEHKKQELEVLSISHQKRIMQHVVKHFSFRNLGIYICLGTGMRIGEICGLKWGDIDLTNGTISVRRTVGRIYLTDGGNRHTELVISSPKTQNSFRVIPISLELSKLIRPLKKTVDDDCYVLTNDIRPTEPRTYRNHYKKLLEQLGLPDMRFHGLRHSFATRCIESQCDCKTVSAILGHADVSTTLNLYVHPNMEQKKKCIDKMFKKLK